MPAHGSVDTHPWFASRRSVLFPTTMIGHPLVPRFSLTKPNQPARFQKDSGLHSRWWLALALSQLNIHNERSPHASLKVSSLGHVEDEEDDVSLVNIVADHAVVHLPARLTGMSNTTKTTGREVSFCQGPDGWYDHA